MNPDRVSITVYRHVYSGGGVSMSHDGPCTYDICGQYLARATKADHPFQDSGAMWDQKDPICAVDGCLKGPFSHPPAEDA